MVMNTSGFGSILPVRIKKFLESTPLRRPLRYLRAWFRYGRDFMRFRRLARTDGRFEVLWRNRWPCVDDFEGTSGFDRHYFYHLAWAARVLADSKPKMHVDISSHLDFCAIISAFMPMEFCEFQTPMVDIEGLTVRGADLRALPYKSRSLPSVSCMHAAEHVGLGRYGDALDPTGDLKAMKELERVIAEGGQLLFIVPVGKAKIQFNAHRIYSCKQILEAFAALQLRELALIPDDPEQGGLIRNATEVMADGQKYGCGCFWFVRAKE